MPVNLIKQYNQLLELLYTTHNDNLKSIRKVFDRDFSDNNVFFKDKLVQPTTQDGIDPMNRLFTHLTTVITNKQTRKREFESDRSIRLHWVKHHLEEKCKNDIILFDNSFEKRTYILNKEEKYVVILEPLRNKDSYFLLTAYKLGSSSYKKIMKKFERDGTEIE